VGQKYYAKGSTSRPADSADETSVSQKVDDVIFGKVVPTAAGVVAAGYAGYAAKKIRDFSKGMREVSKTNYLGGRKPKILRPDNL